MILLEGFFRKGILIKDSSIAARQVYIRKVINFFGIPYIQLCEQNNPAGFSSR